MQKIAYKILLLDSTDTTYENMEGEMDNIGSDIYDYHFFSVPNSKSHSNEDILALLRCRWWDAIVFFGILNQASSFESIIHQGGRNRLGVKINSIPKFILTGYSLEFMAGRFEGYDSPEQNSYNLRQTERFFDAWKNMPRSNCLLKHDCPFGYVLDPAPDGTVEIRPAYFTRSVYYAGGLRGPCISILPREAFGASSGVHGMEHLMHKEAVNGIKLHDFLDSHPEFMLESEYREHFSSITLPWIPRTADRITRILSAMGVLRLREIQSPLIPSHIFNFQLEIPSGLEKCVHAEFVVKLLSALDRIRRHNGFLAGTADSSPPYAKGADGCKPIHLAVLVGRFPEEPGLEYLGGNFKRPTSSGYLGIEIVACEELNCGGRKVMAVAAPGANRFLQ